MDARSNEHHVKPVAWVVAVFIIAASIGGAAFVTYWRPMTRQGGPPRAGQRFSPANGPTFILPLDRPNLPVPLNRDPSNPDAALSLGVSRLVEGDAAGAIDALNAAIRLSTGATEQDARWYLAIALERAGRKADAIQVLDTLCAQQDRSARSCIGLAALRAR